MKLLKYYILVHLKNIKRYFLIPVAATGGLFTFYILIVIMKIDSIKLELFGNLFSLFFFGMLPMRKLNREVASNYKEERTRQKVFLICNIITIATIIVFILITSSIDKGNLIFDCSFISFLIYILITYIEKVIK